MRYLILSIVPTIHEKVLSGIAGTAAAFFAMHGELKQQTFGRFMRHGRRDSVEILDVVEFTVSVTDDAGRAKILEGMLRATIASIGAEGDVRVSFEREPGPAKMA